MKIAIIYNKDLTRVINTFGMQNKELYGSQTIDNVRQALEKGGHNVAVIDGNMHVIESLQHFMPKVVEGERMGMVFNMAYGIQGESRYTHIPSMLEMLGIPYVGSSPSGHALALDKIITKIIMQKHGLPTPDFWVYSSPDMNMSDVQFPVIVKPKMESVSFGLKVVHNEKKLREAVASTIIEFQQQALVEQFIPGREFAVGILGNNPVETFPVLEIDLNGDPNAIQTMDAKKYLPPKKICPADISADLAQHMQKLSKDAFQALQLRDFARVDIRLNENNEIFLLEINSMASLGAHGSYVTAASVAGYNFQTLTNKMLDVAALRYFAVEHIPVGEDIKTPKSNIPTRIRTFIRSKQPQVESLLKKSINQNTFVRNVEGVNNYGLFIKKQLELLGFTCTTYPQVEIGNQLLFMNSKNETFDILLLANLDNNIKIQQQKNFQDSDIHYSGSGIWEHKGGIVALIFALQSLRFIRQLKKMKIGILLTTDDTLQGKFARNLIKEKSKHAQIILGIHGALIQGGIVTSRSGASRYRLEFNLDKCQSSIDVSKTSKWFGQLIESWTNLSNEEKGVIIAPHNITFESNIMEPFAHGSVKLSVRFNEAKQVSETNEQIHSILKRRKNKHVYYQIEGGERRPPMEKTPQVQMLWKKIKLVGDSLDIQLREEHRWSSADICFADKSKLMIDGLGPVGTKEQNREKIYKHSLLERAVLLANLLIELQKDIIK